MAFSSPLFTWEREDAASRRQDYHFADEGLLSSQSSVGHVRTTRSRSFLNRVNDRLRKMLDHLPEDAMQDIDKRSMIRGMFMFSTMEASVFMGKEYSDNLHSIKNTGKNFALQQMFEISVKLISEQADEIYGVRTINWEDSLWRQLSLVGDEDVISLSH